MDDRELIQKLQEVSKLLSSYGAQGRRVDTALDRAIRQAVHTGLILLPPTGGAAHKCPHCGGTLTVSIA